MTTAHQPVFRPGQLLQATKELWLTQKCLHLQVWVKLRPDDMFLVLTIELVPVSINPQTRKILEEGWSMNILTSKGIVANWLWSPTDDPLLEAKPVETP